MNKIPLSGFCLALKSRHKHLFRIMRITYMLLFAAIFCLHAENAISQKITLQGDNLSLKDYLNTIEKQTEYLFIYDAGVNVNKKISVNLVGKSIKEVLDNLSTQLGLSYSQKGTYVVLSSYKVKEVPAVAEVTQQKKKITGIVTDYLGEPIIGANVIEKGTTNGIITDMNGKFALEVAPGAIVQVSYLGYNTQEVKVGNQSTLTFKLTEDMQTLNEIVVVGYGTMRRKDVVSSITTISSEDLNVGVYTTPGELLQGKVPGLVVTQDANPNAQNVHLTLRGASTFRSGAAQEPYYIVDGVPGVDLSLVSPDDIENIDVLRDASATAIYGSKAANGVIIVTTKKGKEGRTNVTYSGYVAASTVAKKYDVMDADEYRAWMKENNMNIAGGQDLGVNTNWQDEVERTGFSHNHALSVSGGNEKTTFQTSFNYMKNSGVIMDTDLERFIGRSFVQTKTLKDHLILSLNLNASLTQRNDIKAEFDGKSAYDAMAYYMPTSPVRNEDGSWFENLAIDQYYNPVSMIKEQTNFYKTKRILATGTAQLNIIDGLDYHASLSYQNSNNSYNRYASSKYIGNRGDNGYALRQNMEDTRKVFETYLNFNRTFRDVHTLGAMVGYSWEESNDNDGFQAMARGFYDDQLSYHNLGMSNYNERNDYGNQLLSTLRMISYYGRFNYSYAGKYLLQASVRRDGSSAFGKNNRWATFPSGSVAWRLSEEDFIKNLNIFDDLKFRVGYGVSGNSLGFDVFSALQLYGTNGWTTDSSGKQIQALAPARNANPDLKWEKTSMFNIGVDFGFFKNRLNGTIEYYSKDTKDLIADYNVSTAKYLYGTMTANVGEITNKGVELTVNAVPVQTKDWRWNTTLNLSHNKNNVKRISNDEFSRDFIEFDDSEMHLRGQSGYRAQRIIEGKPIGTFFIYEWAGYNDEGRSVFYAHDGKTGERLVNADGSYETTASPQEKDRAVVGNAQPDLTVGWNNTVSFKKWSLTAFFTGVFGNDILNASKASLSNMSEVGSRNFLSSVRSTEKVTDGNSAIISNRYIENGSYIRLQSLSLGYDFGNVGSWVNDLRLTVTANNVFTITGYDGIDPEVSLSGRAPGIDNRMTYPRTRTFMFGVNINF